MGDTRTDSSRQWAGRPRVAKLLRFLVWLAPIMVSVVSTHFLSKLIPRPPGLIPAIGWFIGLCVTATVILVAVDKIARRLLPLAALLQLSLVFPDSAPSRFKAALRTQTVRQLEQRVADIKESGLSNDPAIAAETLIELIAALSAHDRLTRGHAERVRAYSRMIGEELKLSEHDLDLLQWAGLAHDVGKLFVPGEILNKTSRLTDEEFEIIKRHPGWGAELCEPLRPWLGDWVDAVGEHHERWDGKGYPNGLAGTDISLAARIVSVADVFDVITSIRSYKSASSSAEAREELAKCAGTQFDERIVRAFLNISLGRLRLAMGPLSWMAQVPIVAQMPLVPVAGAAASVVVTGGAMLAGGTFAQADQDPPEIPAAVALPLPETTLPEPLPPTTVPLVIVTTPAPAATTPPASAPPATVAPPPTTEPPTSTTSTTSTTTVPDLPVITTTSVPAPTTTSTTTTTTLPPFVALNRAVAADEDSTIQIDVGNGGGTGVVARLLVTSAHGTVEHLGGTVFTFRGADDFNGETSFEYEIRDALGRTSSGSATISVIPVPDAPRAVDDIAAVNENDTVEVAVLANDVDPDGDQVEIVAVSSADGSVSTDGVTIRYSPAMDTNGLHRVDYVIEDDSGRADGGTVQIAVSPVNSRPTMVDPGDRSVDEGAALSFVVDASDPDVPLDVLTFSLADGLTPVPTGATIDPTTGLFTWTPSESQGGTSFSFNIRVTDDGVPSRFHETEVAFGVAEVNDAPVLTPIGDRVVAESTPVAFVLSASDSDQPADVLTYSASSLPPGAILDTSTGAFSWTPSESQGGANFPVTFAVTDDGAGALGDTESVVLSVSDLNEAPIVVDPGAQSVDEGQLLSFTASASDGDVPANALSFSLADGLTPVPAGASIDAVSGVFSWTPSEAQGATSYSFRIRVTDDGSPDLSDEVEFSIVVNEVNQAPVLADPGVQTVGEGMTLSFTLSASDADLPAQNLTYSAIGLPAGALFDPTSGTFFWTPSETQGGLSIPVVFSVADDGVGALTDAVSITIDVIEINAAPVLAPIGDRTSDEGVALAFTLSATDSDLPAQNLAFSASGLPAGATLDGSTGAFSWTPSEVQGGSDFPVIFTVADDGAGTLSDSESVVLAAVEVNEAPVLADPGAQSVDEGVPLLFTASATDVDVPAGGLVFTLVDGLTPVPSGAAIDSVTGEFSWTPSELQGGTSYSFTVRVTDDGVPTLSDEAEVSFVVNEVNQAPVLAPIGDQATGEGTAMSFTLSATDQDLPADVLGFTAVGLPAGATLNGSTGAFSWTPTEAQGGAVFNVTFSVADDSALADSETVQLSAAEVNEAPSITDPGDQASTIGEVVSLNLTALDIDDPTNDLVFAATGLPAGLGIDTGTGLISGSPTTIETVTVTVTVTETDGVPSNLSDSATFGWTVAPVSAGHILISEIATSGPNGATDEFIELYNPTASAISIAGWEVRQTDGDMVDGPTTVILAGVSIPANRYFLISHADFSAGLGANASYSAGELVPGSGVGLFDDNGVVVDAVGTGPVGWWGLAGSEYGEGTYLPPMGGTVEQSYERKSGVGNCVDTDDNAADFVHNMGSRNPSGLDTFAVCGTPAPLTPPPPPDHLVISEFRFDGPGGGDDEFVEIFNPSTRAIKLLNYELRNQDGQLEARIDGFDLLRLGTDEILPGEHLVFGSATYAGNTPYARVDILTSGRIKNGSGVYLVDPGIPLIRPAEVVDAVSTGGNRELEGNRLPVISGRVIHSYERLLGASGGNCFDTDDNVADFFHNFGSENPQRLGATATECPV